MTPRRLVCLLTLFSLLGLSAAPSNAPLEPAFEKEVKPFLEKNCLRCHNADNATFGIRVDQLGASLDEPHYRLWERVAERVGEGTMPPKGMPQPTSAERERVTDWVRRALDAARARPVAKNGSVRRLTVAQYRNTLRELLRLDDDLTEILPPDAVSKDGFLNNRETLQLSPLLLEAYFEIAEEALNRAIVDPKAKPSIQNFRVDLGAGINRAPLPEELILGANSHLLKNSDFTVTQLTARKPFAFEPFLMRTKYRFIEGYKGNDTVRGWRDFDSIYHAVFACMRGSGGYPKGTAYSAVPQGLLLRPAIPNDELFTADGTYGPKANFKISLRELPDHGRFRVTVTAARYDDALLLGAGDAPRANGMIVVRDPKKRQTVAIAKPGIYQVDVYASERLDAPAAPDRSRLNEALAGPWPGAGKLEGEASHIDAPIGKAVSLDGNASSMTVPRDTTMDVGAGDFTVAAWIHPRLLRRSGLVSLGAHEWTHGWLLEMPDNKGVLRFETSGPDNQSNGEVASPPGVLRADAWQHVTAVVGRGKGQSRLYVNGFLVATGDMGAASLDNPRMNLRIGRIGNQQSFRGEIGDVRIYRRALGDAEIQALLEPGRKFVAPPAEKPQLLTLTLGGRQFAATFERPAFLVARFAAGPLEVQAEHKAIRGIDRIVLTPLGVVDSRRFLAFEKRAPKLGVHLGLRRDCGSTFAPVGEPQVVAGTGLARYVFEGAIRNYPSPDVEKDNVNYLAGIREIAVRSEYTDDRDMPRLLVRSVEFEGPHYDAWPPRSHRAIFVDPDPRRVIRSFAARAYRRPLTAAEEASLDAVYRKSQAANRSVPESIKDTLQVVLTSPQFLFLIESSATSQAEPLNDFELASKLSYFLWNGPPDATTLRLARTGTLRSQLDAEVARMVADPRFSRFAREFTSQWLSLDKFQVLEPDRKRFPKLTRHTRAQLSQEPVAFVEHLVRQNLPARNLIASDFVMANEAVASYYDLGAKTESGFRFVPVAHGRRELGGVLTQAAILAGLSDGRESNPVKRGAWLARRIVAEPPDDPPPNVPALREDTKNLTLRQRLEQHRSQQGCLQCHMKVDPWGVALEEFDAGGRLKSEPADAQSTLPDRTEIRGIDDLRRYLGEDRIDQVAFSTLKHLTIYATGRSLTYSELDRLKRESVQLKASGYRMQDMVKHVVKSPFFLEK